MNRAYIDVITRGNHIYGEDGEILPPKKIRVEHEPKLDLSKEDLENWNFSVLDAVRILVTATEINGIEEDREVARVIALTKVQTEFLRLSEDAFFAGITLELGDIVTLYAKFIHPNLGQLTAYETSIRHMDWDQKSLRLEFARILGMITPVQ